MHRLGRLSLQSAASCHGYTAGNQQRVQALARTLESAGRALDTYLKSEVAVVIPDS